MNKLIAAMLAATAAMPIGVMAQDSATSDTTTTTTATAPNGAKATQTTTTQPDGSKHSTTTTTDAQGKTTSQTHASSSGKTFSIDEINRSAGDFFGETTEGLAKAIEKAFKEQGEPVAYIAGDEASGAVGVGLRYGDGTMHFADGRTQKVYWQGPSIGWDLGGNASKVFTLVYNLDQADEIYRRFPGVDGSLYFVAGVGMNYQRADDIVLAPIRTGVGLRAGASVGYLSYSREKTWLPF